MRRAYSLSGTFSTSASGTDIEKVCDAIHRWRRTKAMASTKVGDGLAYQAAVRWTMGRRSCDPWAARAIQENKPIRPEFCTKSSLERSRPLQVWLLPPAEVPRQPVLGNSDRSLHSSLCLSREGEYQLYSQLIHCPSSSVSARTYGPGLSGLPLVVKLSDEWQYRKGCDRDQHK